MSLADAGRRCKNVLFSNALWLRWYCFAGGLWRKWQFSTGK